MSLKRLLNPDVDSSYDVDNDHYPSIPWNVEGLVIDDDPIPVFQDLAWPQYVEQVFGEGTFEQDLNQDEDQDQDQNQDRENLNLEISHAQHQIERVVAENERVHPVSSSPESTNDDEEICLGMVHHVSIQLRGNMSELDSKLRTVLQHHSGPDRQELRVENTGERYVVKFLDEDDDTVIGEVNAQWEKAMERVEGYRPRYECFAAFRNIRETIAKTTALKTAIARLNINVYSSRSNSDSIGQEFSEQKVYLQKPHSIRPGIRYDNPHYLKLKTPTQVDEPVIPQPLPQQVEIAKDRVDEIRETVDNILSSLRRDQDLVALEGDRRLKTKLLPHQKKGLDFMLQRENGPISEEYLLWQPEQLEDKLCYRHAVSNAVSYEPQSETGGGILADEMGMGKTLSVLALVLRTLEEAHTWAREEQSIQQNYPERSGATLIIASSDIMINEWKHEMNIHFDKPTMDGLRIVKYHGQRRETDLHRLSEADMVLTTYHTLSADFKTKTARNPLKQLEWYRIVLDEAHIIRRQNTGLYKTVTQLKARSRWCLTGTPIQNCFEDIGSLFAFLRINPLHSMATFRTSIVMPFNENGKRRKLAVDRLTRVIESLCLHRKKKNEIILPDQLDRIREIEFSAEEEAQYSQTQKMMHRAIRNQTGIFDHKGALGNFQMLLQLRIICNHGTFQHPFSWNRRKLHLLEEKESLESLFGSDSQVTCSNCRQSMPMFGSGTLYKTYSTTCRHTVCLECIQDSMLGDEDSLPVDCPPCRSLGFCAPAQMHSSSHSAELESYFRPEGYSSKMEALMSDVVVDVETSKSIIFSHWTRTLDLIEAHLKKHAVVHRRIDGECPTKKREKILDEFATDDTVRVLIMTTGTGAVGLNLATANRVFLVEPQWNPSVEKQAIARAIRIGQEHAVQVTRYIVAGTVEQDMKVVQDRKLEIAGIAWN